MMKTLNVVTVAIHKSLIHFDLDTLTLFCLQCTAENKMLKERLSDRDAEIKRLKEECALLKHQLEVYHEDFKKERADRELTHQKFSKMETQYNNLAMVGFNTMQCYYSRFVIVTSHLRVFGLKIW